MKQQLYICNNKRKSNHCLTKCFHGVPHQSDGCKKIITCSLGKGIHKVKCRPLLKKELKNVTSL